MITAQHLVVERGGRRILDLAGLNVMGGQVLGILGPNGAGKSTLLRVLAGEMRPDSGLVRFLGQDLREWDAGALARRRAVLPQASMLGFPLRAAEVVALGRTPWAGRETAATHDEACATSLRDSGVTALAGRWYASLSGGEQQRVQLARVLAQLHGATPGETALLLDEPTASLDLPHQHAILRTACRRAAQGATVIVVVHDIALAARYCGQILLMADGRLVAAGPTAAVLTEDHVGAAYGVSVRRVPDPAGREVLFVLAD